MHSQRLIINLVAVYVVDITTSYLVNHGGGGGCCFNIHISNSLLRPMKGTGVFQFDALHPVVYVHLYKFCNLCFIFCTFYIICEICTACLIFY
jgi:hypothetical protein